MELPNGTNQTNKPENPNQTNWKGWLQLYIEHDADGREYFIDWSGCQSRCYPACDPSYKSAPASGKLRKTLISLAIAKVSVGSYIPFIPNLKHWKPTGRKYYYNSIPGKNQLYLIIPIINLNKRLYYEGEKTVNTWRISKQF